MPASRARGAPTDDDGRDAITDVSGIRVGHWTNRRAATGCTVILCPPGTTGGVDVRGAAPGTRETELLRPGNLVEEVHGLLLSGGSAFGLDAAGGVMRYLSERGTGYEFANAVVPIVPAAILFDLEVGRVAWPGADDAYRAASRARGGRVEEGSAGAGTGATVAKLAGIERAVKGGLGTASERLDTGVVVGALAAVNALGAIREPATGEVIAGPRDDGGGFFDVEALLRTGGRAPEQPSNTTLAVVATSAALTKTQANRLATVAHDGLARTITPAHMRGDGDIVFALATGEHPVTEDAYRSIEALATRALERAILRGVLRATRLAGVPAARDLSR